MLFKPYKAFKSILEITPEMLKSIGIKAILLDLDNTLTTHNNPRPADGVPEWLDNMKKAGIKPIIVSNNHAPRVEPFAKALGINYIPEGAKPLPIGYNRALKKLHLRREQVCAVGDQIFTDVLGANLAGIRCFFVYPIEPETHFFFKIKRAAEKPFLPKI